MWVNIQRITGVTHCANVMWPDLGFRTYDALHLACAEQATVDIFLTTDDHVLRIATRHTAQLQVRVADPLAWLLEVIEP